MNALKDIRASESYNTHFQTPSNAIATPPPMNPRLEIFVEELSLCWIYDYHAQAQLLVVK
jgi:hypothetical protein